MSWYRVTFKGSLGSVERFSTSAAFGIVGLSPDTPDQTDTDGILAEVLSTVNGTDFGAGLRAMISSSSTITAVRVERRAEDESILNVAEGLVTTPLAGTGTASKTPQDSFVISLRTATPGARGRGRMYLPALGATLSPSFTLSTPSVNTVIGEAKIWLQAINTAIDDYYIGASSALRAALSVRSVTDHVCRDVTQIQIGSVLDTQRRRRDDLPETYTSIAYP